MTHKALKTWDREQLRAGELGLFGKGLADMMDIFGMTGCRIGFAAQAPESDEDNADDSARSDRKSSGVRAFGAS